MRAILQSATVLAAFTCASAYAATLNVDFAGPSGQGTILYAGLAAAPDASGAGAIWNAVEANDGSSFSDLVDSTGKETIVSLDVPRNWGGAFIAGQEQNTAVDLMRDYIYSNSGSAATQLIRESSISGLTPNTSYDLYFYGQGDAAPGQNAGFRIGNDVRQTNYDGSPSGDGFLVEDIEYVKFSGIVADGSGTIAFDWFNPTPTGLVDSDTGLFDVEDPTNTGSVGANNFTGFNGLQIVGHFRVPEPSTALLTLLAAVPAFVRRRS